MGNLSIDHVIMYKDFKILDENKEYLSGYYGKEDQKRIIKAQKIKVLQRIMNQLCLRFQNRI